jgi:hypothetical protein
MRTTSATRIALIQLVVLVACNDGSSSAPPPENGARDESEVSMDSRPKLSARDLSSRARLALQPEGGSILMLSPALPTSWPTTSAVLEWFAYKSQPLPTGVIASAVSGPVWKVTLTLPDGEPRVERPRDATVENVRAEAALSVPDLAAAEQALVDVVSGVRTAEDARADLSVYGDWADAFPVMGDDLRRRKPELFQWIEEGRGERRP